MTPKLFRVVKTSSGYGWSETNFERYFLSLSLDAVTAYVEKNYGPLYHYYRYDEAESRISIDEVEVSVI
jgi:hypothetical protein